ncbi:ArnT family glycosyltransferase [Halobaculum rubrum]|uniref:ArnT family glycosyltransferase n=1 Tax=Halobaculum rubrum TaxID=2872158 RepID=UPI001CA3CB97|nr:glycosyltransferase family 39 protein [Halobaculum rubrum]QZX99896.1 glycosyltransferase family 39 protein [Halobaculum rubrum]
MWERWRSLERETRLVVGLAVGFVAFRVLVASLSGFGFHQGWNEGHYALIARGFLDHSLVPRYAGRYVYSVPPLFPYTVAASYLAFGTSVVAARLPSILATGGLIVATYALGRELFDRRTALVGSALLAVLPFVQLYGGRVQTDMLMTALLTASLAAIVRGYDRADGTRWLVAGGGLFAAAVAAKQPSLLLAGVVIAWLVADGRFDRETINRTGVLIGASAVFLLPVAAWLAFNYSLNPTTFVTDWRHELFSRTSPFANVRLLLAIGLSLGATPLVLAGAAVGVWEDVTASIRELQRQGLGAHAGPSPLTWWLLLFGAFVFYRTPQGHQYYALVLMPPLALFAARGLTVTAERFAPAVPRPRQVVHLVLVAVVVLSALSGTVVLFELSGEFSAAEGGGSHVAADAGEFVGDEVPENATVLVESGYSRPVMWYVRGEFPLANVSPYGVPGLDEERIRRAESRSAGPVYVVYPDPAWAAFPAENATVVHRTESYDLTVMAAVGAFVQSDSKFSMYLNDRGLVIYRLNGTA